MPQSELHPDRFDHLEMAREIIHDNPAITGKICVSANVQIGQILPLMSETVRFLNLIAFQETQLTPSVKVDLAWHEFILCTRYYQSWCERHWHHFIHHNPGGDPQQNQNNFKTTIKLYQKYFGNTPVEFWGQLDKADCGNCSAISDKQLSS